MENNQFNIEAAFSDYPTDNNPTGLAARMGVSIAADVNPDTEAELKAIAQRTGVPIDAVREYPEDVRKQDKLDSIDFDNLAKTSPVTTYTLADVEKAKIVHDDIPNLSAIESALQFGKDAGKTLGAGVFAGTAGIAGAGEALSKNIGDLFNPILPEGYNPWYKNAADLQALRHQQQAWSDYLKPEATTTLGKGVVSGVMSLGQNIPTLAAAILTRNPNLALSAMTGMSFGQTYGEDADKGINTPAATIHATANATTEYVTEKFGIDRFFGDLRAGSSVLKTMLHQVVPEIVGEQAATALQGLTDWTIQHPDKPVKDYLDTMPEAAAETLVATLVGMGGNTALLKTIDAVQNVSNLDLGKAKRTESTLLNLDQLKQLMAASKVQARDPALMHDFIEQATETGDVKNLYIDAQTLMQSGVADKLNEVLPNVAEQLSDALVSGGEILISFSDYLTHIANTELDTSLADHLRIEGEDYTRATAQDYIESHAEELKTQIDKALEEHQVDDAFKTSVDSVKSIIKDQLDTASHFDSSVNDAYASLVAHFFAVHAQKLDTTPEALYQQYPLKVDSLLSEGQVFGQVLPDALIDGMEIGDANKLAAMYRKEDETKSVLLGQTNPRLIEDGLKENAYLSTFSHSGTQSGINHIRTSHGEGGKEIKRGQLPVRDTDIAKIDDIVKNYDAVRFDLKSKSGKPMIAYAKQTEDGALLYFEEVHNKRHDLVAHAMRRYPATSDAVDILHNVPLYVRNDGGHENIIGKPPKLSKEIGAKDSDTFLQGTNNRGSFSPSTNTITLLKNADLSTFLHETGHFFLETQFDMAARMTTDQNPTAGQQAILDDTQALLNWFGVDSLDTWFNLDFEEKRAYHEKFAEGFEKYLASGKAPSLELQPLFQRFRAWIVGVYKSLKNLNVELTPEVKAVMDRLIASDEQIKIAQQARSMMPLFETAEKAGMTPEAFAHYQQLGEDATNTAIDALSAKANRDMQWLSNARAKSLRKMQKKHDTLRRTIRSEVRTQVMSQPVYQAWAFLTGKLPEDNQEQPEILAGRIELSALKAMGLPPEIEQKIIKLKMTAKQGLNADVVSDIVPGFSSGDEMLRAITAAEDPKKLIEQLTDQQMLEQHSELATPEAVQKAADQAISNAVRLRFVATEANALAEATGSVKLLEAAAKELATSMISRLKIRNILPYLYARAEVRAAKAAEKALQKGNVKLAATEKRNQLLNLHLGNTAKDALEDVDKMLRYFKKFGGKHESIDMEYLSQINALLEKFDLRNHSGAKIDETTRLRAWVQSRLVEGELPIVAETLLSPEEHAAYVAQIEQRDSHGRLVYIDDEERLKLLADAIDRSAKRSYKESTFEELQGLYETIQQIEHLGRLKSKLLTDQDGRTFISIRDEIAESIAEHSGEGGKNTRTPNHILGKWLVGIKDFGAAHIKVATWARQMDGGKDNGPVWRYLIKPANARATQETSMRAEATAALDTILRPILDKVPLTDKMGKGKTFASIPGASLNWQERFAMLLNMGNESNLQRLMAGGIANITPTLTMPQILDVVKTFSFEELYAAQQIWDHFETYRPLIAEKEKRVTGVEPKWIPIRAIQLVANDGRVITLRGGYYPVKFDARVNIDAAGHAAAQDAKDLMKAAYSAAVTQRSFTKDRVPEVHGRALLLNMTGLYSGVNDVIHDLAWHEWVIDANRLLRSSKIDVAVREFYGPEVKKQFDNWRNDIIVGQRKLDHSLEKLAYYARRNVSISGLGLNLMSAAKQPLGITNSVAMLGRKWIVKGVKRYAADPIQATKDAQEKSEWLRNRGRTQIRELNELRNQVEGQTPIKEFIGKYGYWLMVRTQTTVDIPTWWAGYEKAIAKGFNEDTAIALADQGVKDSQGGGEMVDQSAIERAPELAKLFLSFYGFMSTTLNVAYGTTITEKSKAKIVSNLLLTLAIPVVLGDLFAMALTPSGDDNDDDKESLIGHEMLSMVSFLMGLVPGIREFSGMLNPKTTGYSGPTGLRVVNDIWQLGSQIKQGEFDDAFRKQSINVLGGLTGIPSAQINKTLTGAEALAEGKTNNPMAIGFGFKN